MGFPNSFNGTLNAFVLPGYAFTPEECVAYSSLKTWMSPARDGYMRNRGGRVIPKDPIAGVDMLVR
jgi:hypothetical protein